MKTALFAAVAMSVLIPMQYNAAFAQDNIERGQKISKKCRACHTLEEGEKNKLGPNLYGIIDRPAGRAEGYNYSEAMISSGITWDEETLLEYISKPKEMVEETKMTFKGIKGAQARRDLVAYLKSLVSG